MRPLSPVKDIVQAPLPESFSVEQRVNGLMTNALAAMRTLSLRAAAAVAALDESRAAEAAMAPTLKALQQENDTLKSEYLRQRETLEDERAAHEAARLRVLAVEKEGHHELETFLSELEKEKDKVATLTADNQRLASELAMESTRSVRLLQEERAKVQLLTVENADMMSSFQSEWEQRVATQNGELAALKAEKQRMDDTASLEEIRRREAEEAAAKLKAAIDADQQSRSEREKEREMEFQAAEETLAYVRRIRNRFGKNSAHAAFSPQNPFSP